MFFDHLPRGGFICAHRGARSIAPENTLFAMQRARECGAHCWETDVRMSRDGELIIFHDATLGRTTNIAAHEGYKARIPWAVNQFSGAELSELDAGSWFLTDDPFGTIASGEVSEQEQKIICGQKIPLLGEVLSLTKIQKFPVNLEIKDLGTPPGEALIVDKIVDMLRETGTMDLVLLSSFRYEYLHRARELDQAVALAVLAEGRYPLNLLTLLDSLSATAYHPDAALCDPDLIRELQRANFRINPWTVNNIPQAKKMLQDGMGVITDWPQRLSASNNGRRV